MKEVPSVFAVLGDVASLVATPLLPTHYAELFLPLANAHKARVEAVRVETPGVKTIVLRPGRGWQRHRAGQHVRVGLAIDGRLVSRTYSVSSPPERRSPCIDLTVKAQGRVSNALHGLEIGAFVTLGPASGDFVLPDSRDRAAEKAPLLFVTGGSGITPVAAMVRSLAARNAVPDVRHVHYARTAEDVIFGEELRSLAIDHPGYHFIEVHTATDRRRFDARQLDALVTDWRLREAWACGPLSLLDAIGRAYASDPPAKPRCHAVDGQPPGAEPRHLPAHGEAPHGAPSRPVAAAPPPPAGTFSPPPPPPRLRVERFRAALAVLPPNARGGRARFTLDAGRSPIDADADAGAPLLQVAEQAGLAPRHGCRMGICHTCDSTLVAGRVRDLRTGTTIDEPGARVQICVCAAAGDVELAL